MARMNIHMCAYMRLSLRVCLCMSCICAAVLVVVVVVVGTLFVDTSSVADG